MMKSEVNDFTNKACDAVSTAIAFTAEQAVYGSEKPQPASGGVCSPTRPENMEKYRCP